MRVTFAARLMGKEQTFSPVVVAPTFDNAGTLRDVVTSILATGFPLIVVNDGSLDGTAEILAGLSREAPGRVEVVTHQRNCGKAAALRSGFALARAGGYTHAVSIDTDAQLDPAEIPRLVDAARSSPTSLILGTRDDNAP